MPTSAKTMQFRFVDGFVVGVHKADGPLPGEWTAHCDDLHRRRRDIRGVIIFTAGGGPSSKQRGELRDALMGQADPTAILTTSGLVRGIITSLNWFFPGPNQVEAFAPAAFREAFAFVQSHTGAVLPTELVLRTLRDLALELGQPLPFELAYGESTRPPKASGY